MNWESDPPCVHDEGHCIHWYDGERCCRCGAPELTNEERIEFGMPLKEK